MNIDDEQTEYEIKTPNTIQWRNGNGNMHIVSPLLIYAALVHCSRMENIECELGPSSIMGYIAGTPRIWLLVEQIYTKVGREYNFWPKLDFVPVNKQIQIGHLNLPNYMQLFFHDQFINRGTLYHVSDTSLEPILNLVLKSTAPYYVYLYFHSCRIGSLCQIW